jgi:hypothetical protein
MFSRDHGDKDGQIKVDTYFSEIIALVQVIWF